MGEDDRYHPVVLHNASHLAKRSLKPTLELIVRDVLRRLPVSPALDNLLLFRRQWRNENAWVEMSDTPFQPDIEEIRKIAIQNRIVVRRVDDHRIECVVLEWQALGIATLHSRRRSARCRAAAD